MERKMLLDNHALFDKTEVSGDTQRPISASMSCFDDLVRKWNCKMQFVSLKTEKSPEEVGEHSMGPHPELVVDWGVYQVEHSPNIKISAFM